MPSGQKLPNQAPLLAARSILERWAAEHPDLTLDVLKAETGLKPGRIEHTLNPSASGDIWLRVVLELIWRFGHTRAEFLAALAGDLGNQMGTTPTVLQLGGIRRTISVHRAVGSVLRTARLQLRSDVNQTELARRLGCSRSMVCEWELDGITPLSRWLVTWCGALELSPADVLLTAADYALEDIA